MNLSEQAQIIEQLQAALTNQQADRAGELCGEVRNDTLLYLIKKHVSDLDGDTVRAVVEPLNEQQRLDLVEFLSDEGKNQLLQRSLKDEWAPRTLSPDCLSNNWHSGGVVRDMIDYAEDWTEPPLQTIDELYENTWALGKSGRKSFVALLNERANQIGEEAVKTTALEKSHACGNPRTIETLDEVFGVDDGTFMELLTAPTSDRYAGRTFGADYSFFKHLMSSRDLSEGQYRQIAKSIDDDDSGKLRALIEQAPESLSDEIEALYSDERSTLTQLVFYQNGRIDFSTIDEPMDLIERTERQSDADPVRLLQDMIGDGYELGYNEFKDFIVRSKEYPGYVDVAVGEYDASDEQMSRVLKRALYATADQLHQAEYGGRQYSKPDHPRAPFVRMVKNGTPLYPDSTTQESECASIPGFVLELGMRKTTGKDMDPFVSRHGIDLLKEFNVTPTKDEARWLLSKAVDGRRIETVSFLMQCGFKPEAERLRDLKDSDPDKYETLLDNLPQRMCRSLRNIEQAHGKVDLKQEV